MARRRKAFAATMIGVPLALTAAAIGWIATYPVQKGVRVSAIVVGFQPVESRYGLMTNVVIRAGGRTDSDIRSMSEVSCRVGDTVEAEIVGSSLRLARQACRRLPPDSWE